MTNPIGNAAALSWTPTQAGVYTLRYSASNAAGTGTDDVVVTVADAVAPTPTASTPGALHKIGKTAGYNHVNVGIGFSPGDDPQGTSGAVHRDFDQDVLAGGKIVPGYYEMSADGKRVRMSCHLDGGRTSTATKYPRTEYRELNLDGTKASWNPNAKGEAWVKIRSRVTRMPPNKPQLVLAQTHDASDDTSMIYMASKTTVQAKLANTVVGNLTSSFAFNTDYTAMIRVVGDGSKSRLEWYWNDLATPAFTSATSTRTTGWYMKCGCYGQSWGGTADSRGTPTDAVENGPFIVEMSAFAMWRTGMAEPVGFGTFG